jgi:hypothetical protein
MYTILLRDIASNPTACVILFSIECNTAYYVANLTKLIGAVYRQTPELCPMYRYMELRVDRD